MANLTPSPRRFTTGLTATAALVATALALGGCAGVSDLGLGGGASLASADQTPAADMPQRPTAELEKATEFWGKEAGKDPRNPVAVLNYARNLKALGRKQEALASLQASYMFNAQNREYLSEYGRLSLDLGQVSTAAALLERADDPAKPDWKIISARGTVLAKQGSYKEAITFFERARSLAPGQASVLNNLALAYTMDGQAERAEPLLREASRSNKTDDPRVQQNLALVLDLQGKSGEARNVAAGTTAEPAGAAPVMPVAQGQAPALADAAPAAAPPATPLRATPVKAMGKGVASKEVAAAPAGAMDPEAIIQAAIKADMDREKSSKR